MFCTVTQMHYVLHFSSGLCDVKGDSLLTLFHLQKQRVLGRMKEGGKAPKAVRVSGEGLGAWDPVPALAPVSD